MKIGQNQALVLILNPVNDLYENIAYLNWLPGWIDRYFF